MMMMLRAAEHVSDILAEFEYAPRHQLRFKLNDLLQMVINLNSGQIDTLSAESAYHNWLREVNVIAQGKFELGRFVEVE